MGHTSGVTSISADWDNDRCLSAANDGTLRLWKLGDGELVETLPCRIESGISCTFVDWDKELLLCGAGDGTLRRMRLDGTIEKFWRRSQTILLSIAADMEVGIADLTSP